MTLRTLRYDFMDADSEGLTPNKFKFTMPQPRNGRYTREDYLSLNHLFKTNGIAHMIVAKPAQDATRNGWRIIMPDDSNKQEQYQQALDNLNLKDVLSKELIYQRLHGDGYATIGVREIVPTNTAKPLRTDNIANISFVHAFGETHVRKNESNNDPTSPDYMKESAVVIDQTQSGYNIDEKGNQIPNDQRLDPIVIDASRYFHITLDKMEDDISGTSFLTRCMDQVKILDSAAYSIGKILYDYTTKVLHSDHMANESEDEFRHDKAEFERGLSTQSIAILASDEVMENISVNASGVNDLVDNAWRMLASASGIPKSVLTGEQAGTLAGASQDVINYYDNINSIQEEILRPQLERIIELLMWSTDVAGGSEDPEGLNWKLVFKPLQSLDDKTKSEIQVNTANSLSTLISSGIIDEDQGAAMLAGQNNDNVDSLQGSNVENDSTDYSDEEIDQMVDDLNKRIANRKNNEQESNDGVDPDWYKV